MNTWTTAVGACAVAIASLLPGVAAAQAKPPAAAPAKAAASEPRAPLAVGGTARRPADAAPLSFNAASAAAKNKDKDKP